MSSKSYGVDIALEYDDHWADLKGNSADIPLVEGADNLSQAIRNRLMTPLGSNPRHPSYGSKLHSFIGKGNNSIIETIMRMVVMEALQDEGRIQLVTEMPINVNNDIINITIYVISIYSTSLLVKLSVGDVA